MLPTHTTAARRGLPLALLTALLALLLAPAARAATLTVTDTSDSATDPNSLRYAIATANGDGGDDTIQFSLPANSVITVGSTLTITAPMTIQGPGAAGLAIDGGHTGGSNGVGVFSLSGGTAGQPVALAGLTLQHGYAGVGGDVLVSSGVASLTDCVLTHGIAALGGCVCNNGTATLTGCTFADSEGVLFGGGLYNAGTATLTGCAFTNNSSSIGGGLENYINSTASLTGCTFIGNQTQSLFGGSGAGAENERGGTVTFKGCAFAGNSAGSGGGLQNQSGGTATLVACSLAGNSAGSDGGGLYNEGTATLTGCALTGNSAQTDFAPDGLPFGGGGLYNNGTLTLTGCVLRANVAALKGGGLDNEGGTATLTGCTLTGNSAPDHEVPSLQGYGGGGAIYAGAGGAANLTDDILYGDSSPIGAEINGAVAASHCDIQQSGFGQPGSPATPDASGSFDADPLFVSGSDLHLQSGSPCAGTGTVSAPSNSYLPYDIDGRPRPTPGFSAPSIGAYEAAPTGAYSLVVENTLDGVPQSLRAAVQCADDYPNAAITFDPAVFTTLQTIPLTGGQLTLTQPMSITGPAPGVAIDGGYNHATGSGGVRIFEVTAGTSTDPVTLRGLTLQNGSAGTDVNGGGGLLNDGGAVALTGCTLTGNIAPSGGGLSDVASGAATLAGCFLTGNTATQGGSGGGGVFAFGSLTMTDCVLAGNSAPVGGGLLNDGGTATVTECTFTGNTAASGIGGGLASTGTALLTDDILYGDTGGEIASPLGGVTTASYCDVGQPGYGLSGTPARPDAGHNFDADPQFVNAPLDLHVMPGSPVVGLGTTSAPNNSYRPFDITGAPRDRRYPTVGAYEGLATVTITVAGSPGTVVPGGSATFLATATNTNPYSPFTPQGTVDFAVGNSPPFDTVNLAGSGGTATATSRSHTFPDTGSFTVTAAFTPLNGFVAKTGQTTETVLGTPKANAQTVSVPFNTTTGITLTGSDPNGETLTYAFTKPAHGTVTGTAPSLTYTPTNGYHGADSFTFTVTDTSKLQSPPATVTLTVAAGTPTANAQGVTTNENAAKVLALTGSDPDVPALTLTYALGTAPAHGALTGFNAATGAVTYTPTANYFGPDSFTFTVSNGTNISAASTVSLTVNRVASDVTGQVAVVRGGYRFVRATGHYLQPLTLTNTGPAALSDPISLVLDNLTPASVTLVNASGTTSAAAPAGSPYVTLPAGGLAGGASESVTLEFSAQPSGYAVRVLAGPGAR